MRLETGKSFWLTLVFGHFGRSISPLMPNSAIVRLMFSANFVRTFFSRRVRKWLVPGVSLHLGRVCLKVCDDRDHFNPTTL